MSNPKGLFDLKWSVRAQKVLMRAINAYGTKEEKAAPAITLPLSFLTERSPEELLELKNCGRTTLNEIEDKISRVGLKLNRQRFTDKAITKQLQREFGVCPYCKSDSINAGDYDGDKTLSCKVTCDECDATWVEVYRFVEAVVDTEPVSSSTGLWKVQYRIVAGTTNEVVSQGEQIVNGDNKRCAAHAAEEQIADLDPKYDGRLDPRIEIVEIEPADEDDSNPEGVDDGDVERQGDRTAGEVGQSEDRPVESGPGQSEQL